MMPHDDRLRKPFMQLLQQPSQRFFLGRGAGVGRLPNLIESTLITDTDTVAVVHLAVRPHLPYGSARLYGAVPADDEMIADGLPSPGTVPPVDVRGTAPLPRTDSRAMYDE